MLRAPPDSPSKDMDFECLPIEVNPESNEIEEANPDIPSKKRKLDDEVSTAINSSTTVDSLPNEIMIEVFKYLNIKDRLQVQKVCSRWYQLVKSEVLWKHVQLSGIHPSFFIEIITSLPSCVSHLRLECCYEALPISLPEIMAKLNEQCPFLKTFFLGNIHLVKNLHTVKAYHTRRSKLLNAQLLQNIKSTLDMDLNQFIETEFYKEEDIGLLNAVLPELKILSLRRVLFSPLHLCSHISISVLPKIIVLDLSYSRPLTMAHITDDLFSTLADLEELYLAGWHIKDHHIINFLKNAKRLRILDVEFSNVSGNTISTLKQNNIWLERLYLSCTAIRDICKTNVDKVFFPVLQSLCVKHTEVTQAGIEELLIACPSLKHVNVSNCENITKSWYHSLPNIFKQKLLFSSNEVVHCDHFLENKYCSII